MSDLEPYARLGDARWLADRGLFVAEGRLVVRRLVESGRFALESILLTPAARERLGDVVDRVSCPVHVRDESELASLTGFNFHRGCLAIAKRPAPLAPSALAGARLLLVLEGIGNPDNVGGLFRSAAAFGAGGVLLDGASADPFYRKAIRTSMAAVLRVRFATACEWPGELRLLRERGCSVVALTPRDGAEDLEDVARAVRPGDRLALLVGNEGEGLSDAALECADRRVRIPILQDVDSLNVTVAASIALYHLSAAGPTATAPRPG